MRDTISVGRVVNLWPSGRCVALVIFSCALFLPPLARVFIAGEWSRVAAPGFLPCLTVAELAGRGAVLPCTLLCLVPWCLGWRQEVGLDPGSILEGGWS